MAWNSETISEVYESLDTAESRAVFTSTKPEDDELLENTRKALNHLIFKKMGYPKEPIWKTAQLLDEYISVCPDAIMQKHLIRVLDFIRVLYTGGE
jgi:hypothetical protein